MRDWMMTAAAIGALSVSAVPSGAFAQSLAAKEVAVAASTSDAVYARAEAVLPAHIDELVFDVSVRPQWFEDSSRFWYERHTPQGYRYVLVDPAKRSRSDLFNHEIVRAQLSALKGEPVPAEEFRLQGADLSKDERALEFRAGKERFSLDLGTGRVSRLPEEERGVLSPNGDLRAFAKDNNVWIREVSTGCERQLTTDGTALRPYARPVVNVKRKIGEGSNEPELDPDIEWSPQGDRIATYRLDLTGARRLAIVQSTPPDGAPPKVYDYYYSFTGDQDVPLATDVIIDVRSGELVTSKSEPQQILYYGGPYYEWSKDGSAVFSLVPGRGYKTLTLERIDARTGEVKILRQDKSDTYVDYYGHDWTYDEDQDRHFWTADTTGHAHIYTADGKTGKGRQITSGEWRARSVAGTSSDGKIAFVVGSGREAGRDPYYRSLYSVPVSGKGLRDLTPEPLDHDVSVSPDGRFFVDNMSRIDMPTHSVVRDTKNGRIVMDLQKADASRFLAAGYKLPEPFEALAADGKTRIYGAIFKPAGFDPARRYPVIEDVYTGPHYVQTPKSFEAALFYRNIMSLAQLGAIGITIDGRGTWGRSRAFQQPAYKNLHLVGLDDHIAGIRSLADRHSWIDPERVGIYGFSAGGYDVVRAMTRRPDFYDVGVSASGNHDNRLDKATWNEQWMGVELGPLYDENSNVTWAKELEGDLFLAHGELDENVPMAATLRLVDALIDANKDFEFLVVPNADHFLDDSPYFQRRRYDFFTEKLIGRTPPQAYQMSEFEE